MSLRRVAICFWCIQRRCRSYGLVLNQSLARVFVVQTCTLGLGNSQLSGADALRYQGACLKLCTSRLYEMWLL